MSNLNTSTPIAGGGISPNGTGPSIETAIVRFSYAAQQPDELDLKERDELLVLEHVEDGWARGEIVLSPSHPTSKGRIGLYPTNFVSTITTTPTTHAPRNLMGCMIFNFTYLFISIRRYSRDPNASNSN